MSTWPEFVCLWLSHCGQTNWLPFCKRRFKMHCLDENDCVLNTFLLTFIPVGAVDKKFRKWLYNSRTNNDLLYWRIYASFWTHGHTIAWLMHSRGSSKVGFFQSSVTFGKWWKWKNANSYEHPRLYLVPWVKLPKVYVCNHRNEFIISKYYSSKNSTAEYFVQLEVVYISCILANTWLD